MKEQASSIEYAHLVREFQELVGGRIDKIYQEENLFLFSIYTGSRRTNLVIELPNVAFITDNKPSFSTPGGFCTFLRKRLQKGRIQSLQQVGFDRILHLVVEQEQTYNVYIELFGRGNLVVCNEENKIISLYDSIVYADRALRGGQTYETPEQTPNIPEMDEETFSKYFGEEEAVKVLASTLGLGGEYAEYILAQANIPKNDIQVDTKKLLSVIQEILKTTSPEYTEKAAYPISLAGGTKANTFSEAISHVKEQTWQQKKAAETQKKAKEHRNKYEKTLEKQKKQLAGFKKSSKENQRKGELIYEHYQEINELLTNIQTDRKELNLTALKKKYEQHPLVKEVTKTELTIEVNE